jgi:hypothetical protein
MLLKITVGSGLEPSEDLSVGPLNLAVTPRMRQRGEIELDANVFTVLLEVLARELSPIVCDDAVRDPESAHD